MDIASNINIATATARPIGPPLAATLALPAAAPAFAATVAPFTPAVASFALVIAAFAAFAPARPAFAPTAPAFAPLAARVTAATNIASTIRPPPTAIASVLTISIFAIFGFGGALASG